MNSIDFALNTLRQKLSSLDELKLYAIADAAQDKRLPLAINGGANNGCLFGHEVGGPVYAVSPHLVHIADTSASSAALKWIERNAAGKPSVTLLASNLPFDALLAHLYKHLDLRLDDGHEMFLAFWDPAILAALVGQQDDHTLYVHGPIFTPPQRASLLAPVAWWWCWDRDGAAHVIEPLADVDIALDVAAEADSVLPLRFNAAQIDLLVEASVPDHILAHLELNLPAALMKVPVEQRYAYAVAQLLKARTYGLLGCGDLTNYVGLGFMWREDFDRHPIIASLLADVKAKKITFDAAMQSMPESIDQDALVN